MSQPEGYWFDGSDTAYDLLRNGRQVSLATTPPWLVVDASIASITLTAEHWPGTLWRARVSALGDMSGLVDDPGYWRASALELIEQVPLERLFGAHGRAVLDVIERIDSLSPDQADALGAALHPEGWDAYARAWARWEMAPPPAATDADHGGPTLLATGPDGTYGSPINDGLSLISELVDSRARAVDGTAGFMQEADDDDPDSVVLVASPRWRGAADALLQAAIAVGAPEHVPAEDRARLLHPWIQVFVPGAV